MFNKLHQPASTPTGVAATIGTVLGYLVVSAVVILVSFGFLILAWDNFMTPIFHLPTLSLLNAAGLWVFLVIATAIIGVGRDVGK